MEEQTKVVETEGSVSKDTSLDISSLLKGAKEEPVKEKTNLEKVLEANAKEKGLIVENTELEKANNRKVGIKTEMDGLKEADDYMTEQDDLIAAAKQVTIERAPSSPMEMVSMMDSLAKVSKDPEKMKELQENNKAIAIGNPMARDEDGKIVGEDIQTVDKVEGKSPEENAEEEEKKNLINVLIDKTGYGTEIIFSDEERERIIQANELRVTEVEEVSLESIKVIEPQKSFMDSVAEYQMASSKVPVVFPASRFRAYMTGLTYGEMGDISLDSNNITLDQLRKKLTVIYNKMINPSIEFKDFEDFLHKFAYVDIDLATYGLIVATYPELDDIPMECNNPRCKKGFSHRFSPRSLLRFEKCDNKFLHTMKDVVESAAADLPSLVETSPVTNWKRMKLPYSNFIVEIGIASSYDYLYTVMGNILGDKFKESHPDDINGILELNSALLSFIRTIYVPNGDAYVKYTNFEDMINALYMIKPEDIAILGGILNKYQNSYAVSYELQDVECPYCHSKTASVPIDLNYLVFIKYQRLMNTAVDIDSIGVL